MKQIIVKANDSGQRLDRLIAKHFASLPKSMMYKQIRKKNIKVNKKRCTPEQTVNEGDVIELYLSDELLEERQKHYDFLRAPRTFGIIYEDENIALLDKPQGMLCHPDGKEYVNTLVAAFQRYLYEKGEYNPEEENSFSPALANRIDRNTGGIVIGVKNYSALKFLNEKIRKREIGKYYLTAAEGKFEKDSETLTGWLSKDERTNTVTVTKAEREGAKKIVTRYRVLDYRDGKSLVEIELLTGRTHQIRAHLASVGHPLCGDGKYGSVHGRLKQELYSYRISFDFDDDGGAFGYLAGKTFETETCPVKERFYNTRK